MKGLAAVLLVLCVSCAPVAQLRGGVPLERWGLAPTGYYEDEPQAPKFVAAAALSCGVIVGFVIAWPEIEPLFAANLSTWFYGY